jgi:hypothetical protein
MVGIDWKNRKAVTVWNIFRETDVYKYCQRFGSQGHGKVPRNISHTGEPPVNNAPNFSTLA